MTDEPLSLIARLKRHHMFRVASWYATLAYILILVANAVFPDIGLTRDDVRYVIAGLALGFPVILTLSWILIPPSAENPTMFSRWKRLRWRLGAVFSVLVIAFVTVSGVYLWQLNAKHLGDYAKSGQPAAQSIAVLPFEKLGNVSDEMISGVKAGLEGELSGLGTVNLLTLPADVRNMTSQDLGKATGATLVIRGSIQHVDAGAPFIVHVEFLSGMDGSSLHSMDKEYSATVHPLDMQQELASRIAGAVRFMGIFPDVMAKGFPTTRDAPAMNLLRRALMSRRYIGTRPAAELCREALRRDPSFAQAHAYLAFFEAWSFDGDANDVKGMQDEIAQAEKLAPGLPEARLARGAYELWGAQDPDAALKTMADTRDAMPNNTDAYNLRGYILRRTGHAKEALDEFQQAMRLDPYLPLPHVNTALMEFGLRDYEGAEKVVATLEERWPSWAFARLWRAQVGFAYRGDLKALASVVDGDLSAYGMDSNDPVLLGTRLEVAHLEGKYADVVAGLKAYPKACLEMNGWGSLTQRTLCVDSYTAETLRLMGKEKEASQTALLHMQEVSRDSQANPGDPVPVMRLALLQVFGGDASAALKTIAPYQALLDQSPERWTESEAEFSPDVAVVLAWAGQQRQAVDILSRSLEAPFGAHAAVLARDPVWRPLYKEPAFVALLAAHGQQLAYAK